ncbi:MAG TPA: N-acetylneuraminate synthase family protein [Solirubrobacter sp.]
MRINGTEIGGGAAPLVIAEIGNNHDGSIRQAESLIQAAAVAGAGAVKFQTHIAEAEMLPSTPTPPHFDEPRYTFTQRMELSHDQHVHLKAYAEERGLIWFSSPFSVAAVELLEAVGTPVYKVASGEVTNPPLLQAIAATGKPVIVSSGMSGLDDVERAVTMFQAAGSDVLVMQCTSTYPCPPEQVHLRAMTMMAERFGTLVGLSDHTPDIHASVGAVALGAAAVEKHFTLSRYLYGPDHKASLEPADLAQLVTGVRNVHLALGSPEKLRDPGLDPARATFEKSVVSTVEIPAGTRIDPAMLTTKRPGNGIPATRIDEVVGRTTARAVAANVLLEPADLA